MKVGISLAALLLSLAGSPTPARGFGIDWWTLGGGGGTSTGASYSISGIIGQASVGRMSGGTFVLSAGISNGGALAPDTNSAPLTVMRLQVGLNFAKPGNDSINLTAILGLPGITNVVQITGTSVVINLGDAQVDFTLDSKGRGLDANGTCRLAYTKPAKKLPGYWTATISLSKGTWLVPLAAHGLTNETIKKPGRVVTVPVAILIGNEELATQRQLTYTATLNKTGTAK